MKYIELKVHLGKNGEIIKEQLRTRKYKSQPVRRVEIPKPDGGVRGRKFSMFIKTFSEHVCSLFSEKRITLSMAYDNFTTQF